jgi:uncharacterized BrkB/YihY/UPF0761 family membrane protein
MKVPSSGQPTPTSLPGHAVTLTKPTISLALISALFAAIYKILPDNPIAYYSAQIFLLGAEYTRAYAEAHGSQAANR